MRKILLALLVNISVFAQLSTPTPEAVYGGRINAITSIPLNSTQTRVFVATESANSIFYADMNTGGSGTPTFGSFTVMPGAGDDDGYGSNIRKLSAHKKSSSLFFVTQTGDLVNTNPSSSSVTTVSSGSVTGVHIVNFSDSLSYLFFTDGTGLRFGTLDSAATFTEDTNSPISISSTVIKPAFYVSPTDKHLYIADFNSSAIIYTTKDKYNAFTSSTTTSTVNTSALTATSYHWTAFAVGNDGTLFVGGNDGSAKYVAYTKDGGGTWNIVSTGVSGGSGANFAIPQTGTPYMVYFSTIYAQFDSSTDFGTWNTFGNAGMETHPNDGEVFVDRLNDQVIYMTTDQGLGVSINGGSVIKEIDDGITAVQVNDFDMNASKTAGWLASKSGIRHVTDYSTSSPIWSNAIYPNNDGSQYYSAEMIGNDTNSVYVGSVRVYKTTDGGTNWTRVFTAESSPYSFPALSHVKAIEVNSTNNNIVLAGYYIQDMDQGGLFYTTDGDTTWNQLLLRASSTGNDVDVRDIIFTTEGGNVVAYIGVEYDETITTVSDRGYSVYRAEWDGSSWTVRQDMDSAYTSSGSTITATINDLAVSTTGDTVYAAGVDEISKKAKVYYKILSGTNKWEELTVLGFPSSSEIKAFTIGVDTLYCAIDNVIYSLDLSSPTSWESAYLYPVGTKINVLYYDDLLVGTGTGLYGQHSGVVTGIKDEKITPNSFRLNQNYPNPFNPSTKISYQLPSVSRVTLKIYDILGREVVTLINKEQTAGNYKVNFDASRLSSGVYFYRLIATGGAGNFIETKKMILLK